MQFRRGPQLAVLALERESACDVRQCFAHLTSQAADFGQEPIVKRQPQFRAGGFQCVDTMAELRQPRGGVAFNGGGPTRQNLRPRQIICEAVFPAKLGRFVGASQGASAVLAEDIQHGRVVERDRQNERMRQFASQRDGFLGLRFGLSGIAELP